VGEWYDDFDQTSDAQVLALLDTARRRATAPGHRDGPGSDGGASS
jgi:predicted phosphoribosyltransferase